jgi:nitrate reductase cytochrome c-type subunit
MKNLIINTVLIVLLAGLAIPVAVGILHFNTKTISTPQTVLASSLPPESKWKNQNFPYENIMASASCEVDFTRTLQIYYSRREFYGAPPIIPHEIDLSMGNDNCSKCHIDGGYSQKFAAYTPITPHPELENCTQCHVVDLTKREQNAEWITNVIAPPPLQTIAFEGAPPIMPHPLEMRENCIACHSGASAPKEIRTTHPERIHCQACHVPSSTESNRVRSWQSNGEGVEK